VYDSGEYRVTLNNTDKGTLGHLKATYYDAATHFPLWAEFLVVPAKIYDSLVAGSDNLEVDTIQWLGTACAAPSVAGVPEVDLTHVAGATTNVAALATNVDAILTDTGTTLDTKLNNVQGATFDTATDSLEALRNRGDAAWITATGFATPTNITAATGIVLSGVTHTGAVIPTVTAVTNAVAITSNVKKNQALAAFEFMMTDSTTHQPVTGKTVTVTRSIDGGAFAAGTLSSVTEVTNGIYKVDFASGDLNGNVITLRATAATSDDTFVTLVTAP
jgi:hypothetical protein